MHKQDQLTQGRRYGTYNLLVAMRLALRWLRLVGMLGLMLAIADMSSPALAQSAPHHIVIDPFPTFCSHHSYPITVSVKSEGGTVGHDENGELIIAPPAPIIGETINATYADENVGRLSPSVLTATLANRSNGVPGKVAFTFFANNPGTDELTFSNEDTRGYVTVHTVAKVVNCKFTVTGIFEWRDPGGYALITAATAETLIEPDADGNFTASASTTFTGHETCIDQGLLALTFSNAKVTLAGRVDDSSATVTLTFPPIGIESAGCYGNSQSNTGNVAPLTVTVPSSGGYREQSSVISLTHFTASGPSMVYIQPVDPNSGQ